MSSSLTEHSAHESRYHTDLKTPRKKHTVNNQNKPTTSNGLIKMTNLDRIVIYVETSIRVLLHRDRTFGPCAIRFLGRDRCGGVKTRSLVSEWTVSNQTQSVLMTSVNKRIEKRNPFLPTLLHYTLFNDSKTPPFSIFSASHSPWLRVRRKQNLLLVVKAQGRVLFTSHIKRSQQPSTLNSCHLVSKTHRERQLCYSLRLQTLRLTLYMLAN